MPETKKPSRLKNLDELFRLTDDMEQFKEKPAPPGLGGHRYCMIEADQPVPFPGHPFRLYEGERLTDMIDSIRKNGVLVPIILRSTEDSLQILSGHNRVNAAKLAGLKTVPAILLELISDEEAWVYVVETNLIQRSFADMSHSEKAAVIAVQHSKMFSQGKRNDILQHLQMLENPHYIKGNTTSDGKSQESDATSDGKSQKLDTRNALAQEYGLNASRIAQYVRIHQLTSPLKQRLDNGHFAVTPAVALSFLKESEQELLHKCLELNTFSVDIKKAKILRQYSEDGNLDNERIYLILNGELGQKIKKKPNRTPAVKIAKAIYSRYFTPDQPAKEVEGIVEKALELYFSQ